MVYTGGRGWGSTRGFVDGSGGEGANIVYHYVCT